MTEKLDVMTTATDTGCREGLAPMVKGRVVEPGDPAYDQARAAWNLTLQQMPAVIVFAQDADDVAAAVRWAMEEDLGVTVQATGHGAQVPPDDALLIKTSEMTGVAIDPATQTAWVEAGTKWGAVLAAAQEHGLAPLLGSSPDVGAVGYTLGGGLGWLARKYGLAADSALAFEVVTAAGHKLRVSEHEHPDLFWGLRGGGGGLAIVTRMQIRLFPVTTVYAGNLFYPAEMASDVLRRYRDWLPTLPDEMTSSVSLMNVPPLPMMPEALQGKSFAIVRGCYVGDLDAGADLLGYWRDWRAPAMDFFGPLPFTQAATISDDPEDPLPGVAAGFWLRELSDRANETLIRFALPQGGPPPIVFTEVRHIGGAVAGGDAGGAAYGNRDAELLMELVSFAPTPEAARSIRAHIAAMAEALGPDLTGGVYMNFMEGREAQTRVADAFSPEAFRRLQALKAVWDPDNRFRYAYAIAPLP
jgi:FAD/FMN-containing dehydrogenase